MGRSGLFRAQRSVAHRLNFFSKFLSWYTFAIDNTTTGNALLSPFCDPSRLSDYHVLLIPITSQGVLNTKACFEWISMYSQQPTQSSFHTSTSGFCQQLVTVNVKKWFPWFCRDLSEGKTCKIYPSVFCRYWPCKLACCCQWLQDLF